MGEISGEPILTKPEFDFELEGDGLDHGIAPEEYPQSKDRSVRPGDVLEIHETINTKPAIVIPHPTENVAMFLANLVVDEMAIMEAITTLPAEDVAPVALQFTTLAGILSRLTKTAEEKLESVWTGRVAIGEQEYDFEGTARREVDDPEGLKHALAAIAHEKTPPDASEVALINESFVPTLKVMHDPLSRLEKIEKYESTIRDFRAWKHGPKHLKVVEAKKPRATKAKSSKEAK